MTKNILYICLAALLAYSCEQKESFIFAETDGLYFALPDSIFPLRKPGKEIRTDISRIFTETLHGQTLSVCSLPLPETHPINPGNIT